MREKESTNNELYNIAKLEDSLKSLMRHLDSVEEMSTRSILFCYVGNITMLRQLTEMLIKNIYEDKKKYMKEMHGKGGLGHQALRDPKQKPVFHTPELSEEQLKTTELHTLSVRDELAKAARKSV